MDFRVSVFRVLSLVRETIQPLFPPHDTQHTPGVSFLLHYDTITLHNFFSVLGDWTQLLRTN